MSTTIHPTLSKKNPYYIPKHRYYELKHFCLQYPDWQREYTNLDIWPKSPLPASSGKNTGPSDPTGRIAAKRHLLRAKMERVEQAALEADGELADYLLRAVTRGYSYEYLETRLGIPCCRETFYNRYRRFFYILSKET